jgi:hypothetical protein
MQIDHHSPSHEPVEKPGRSDPGGFVMSIALTLFVLTIVAVITMHCATHYGWQVL